MVHSTNPNKNFSELNEQMICAVILPKFGQRYQIGYNFLAPISAVLKMCSPENVTGFSPLLEIVGGAIVGGQ